MGDTFSQLAVVRDGVLLEAEGFRGELEPLLAEALRGGLERLTRAQAGHLASFDEPTRRALDEATAGATRAGVAAVLARLADPELWLSPRTAPDLAGGRQAGWPLEVPPWLARLLGRDRGPEGLGDLDDAGNRIWIAIGSAAGPLDAVLQEFRFTPERRRIGGGRYGVAPRTLPRLDPGGTLLRRWKRYRAALERYEALASIRG